MQETTPEPRSGCQRVGTNDTVGAFRNRAATARREWAIRGREQRRPWSGVDGRSIRGREQRRPWSGVDGRSRRPPEAATGVTSPPRNQRRDKSRRRPRKQTYAARKKQRKTRKTLALGCTFPHPPLSAESRLRHEDGENLSYAQDASPAGGHVRGTGDFEFFLRFPSKLATADNVDYRDDRLPVPSCAVFALSPSCDFSRRALALCEAHQKHQKNSASSEAQQKQSSPSLITEHTVCTELLFPLELSIFSGCVVR